MPSARTDLAVAAVNGKIYAIGGIDNGRVSIVEVYDPASDSWSTAASMPVPTYLLAATEVHGLIYAIGGSHASGTLETVEQYSLPVTLYTFTKN